MGDCDIKEREIKTPVMKTLNEIQEGSSMSSGITLMNKRRTLLRDENYKMNQTNYGTKKLNE